MKRMLKIPVLSLLLLLLLLVAGVGGSWKLSETYREQGVQAWSAQADRAGQWLSATLFSWLEESYAPISGLAALFQNSEQVSEAEFLNAYDDLESRATVFFLDGAAYLQQSKSGAWQVVYSTHSQGGLRPDMDEEERSWLQPVINEALLRQGEMILGPPKEINGRLYSLVALAIGNDSEVSMLTGLINYSALIKGMHSIYIPTGVCLKVEGRFLDLDLQTVWRELNRDQLHSVAERSISGGAELRLTWFFNSRFAGGPSQQLAQIILIVGVAISLIVVLLIGMLLQRNVIIVERVKTATSELESANNKLQLILNNAQIGIAYVVNRKIQWINPKLAELRGIGQDDLIGQDTRTLYVSDEDYQSMGGHYDVDLAKGHRYETELLMRRGEDESYWCRLVGQAVDPLHMEHGSIWLLDDITVQKEFQQQLQQLASTDPLTGLYNRRYFYQLGSREIKRCIRSAADLSILMLDIDFFKQLNDKYGHSAGDEALKHFVQTVQTMLRDYDILGRLGGEEFAAVLPETDLETALKVAERVRKAVAISLLIFEGKRISFTVSIGVRTQKGQSLDLEKMLSQADEALYQAKKGGRDQVVAYSDD